MIEQNIEIWKSIEGYSNYMISNLGNVKSLNYKGGKREKILKLYINNSGYALVNLTKNGKQKTYLVHRLLAQTFIPNPENKPHIDHINTIRNDNRVENLRWVTQKENNNNPITRKKNSKCKKGKLCYKAKIILQFDKDMNFIKKWNCMKDIERENGYFIQNISKCCKETYRTAYGYIWRFAEQENEKVA